MDKPMPNLMFRGMSFLFQIRNVFQPPRRLLDEVGLNIGDAVLDFGCGPGAFVPDAAQRVGAPGKVYALDVHPLALERVQKITAVRGLSNVHTLQSAGAISLPDHSLDVALLFDVFHMLGDREGVLAELHRVLKPGGTLAVTANHMADQALMTALTAGQIFDWVHKGQHVHIFKPR